MLKVRKKKHTKIKKKENTVSKQGRNAFRVALEDFTIWHSIQNERNQRLPGGLIRDIPGSSHKVLSPLTKL